VRIGWISNSFGRNVDFYAACLFLVNSKDLFPEDYYRLRDTRWIFPEKDKFPFLASELNKLVRIVNTASLKPYKLVTKWKTQNSFASHFDDFVQYAFKGYGNSLLGNIFQAEDKLPNYISEEIKKLRRESKGVVGFYARDDSWDALLGHSDAYLKSNRHRNPEKLNSVAFVNSLLELGYSVVRLGRSSEKLFGSTRENFFDYAGDHALWADKYDFLLWREVDFGIVTMGGAVQPAFFFKKPLLMWDFNEPLSGILNRTPNYPEGHMITVPRINKIGVNLSARINNKEFVERICLALITKSSKIPGGTQVGNMVVCEQVC